MNRISDIKLFLFDMDGTLYLGDRLYSFTKELLAKIKAQNKRYMFMTNNSSKSVEDYIIKLKRLGIEATKDEFITSSQATAHYLKNNMRDKKLYVCGTDSLKKELSENGLILTDDVNETECIVMGNDTELTFKKLYDVSYMLCTRELPYIATNLDYVCPTEFGSVPDCGSICDMIYNATGKRPMLIGKPEALMPKLAMETCNVKNTETAVIGDRIYTDIKCGINAENLSILVMSGETTNEILEASSDKPDIVLEDAGKMIEFI